MEQNLNQPPLPQIKYQGIQEVDNFPKTTDNIATLQRDIRKSVNSPDQSPSLTTDLFSGLGKQSQKPRFESYTPYEGGDLYATTSEGDLLSRYENYIPGTDNNERLASQQTTSEKWGNGVTKALAKTGSAILGGTAGLVYGVGAALSDGSFSSIYDNSFSNTLSDWDTKLQYQLPNLYTKQESEKSLFGQIGTANFWSDKFLGGLSFTAGAIVSEGIWAYATGGVSLSSAGARLGTKLTSAGRWGVEALGEASALQGLTKYKGLYKTMLEGTIQAGKIGKSFPNALGKAGELTSSIGVLARSAGYESSVEALQYKKEATENFYQNFAQLNGREPNSEELSEFRTNLEESSNAVFAVNMGILMPSNLVSMGHILDIKSPIKTGFSAFIDKKAFGYGIEKGLDAAGKATYNVLKPTLTQKVARTGFNYVVKPALTEGLFEEGLQGVTTKTANKWLEHSYDPKYSNANLDTIGAFYESMGEQYGTKEGWVENGLGMIIGVVGGSVNARSESVAKAAELGYQASVAETFQTENLQAMLMPNRIQSANRMQGFSEEAKVEAQKGNISRASLAQKSSLLTYINAKLTVGEDVPDIVSEIKMGLDSTTEDQWKDAGVSADQIDEYKADTLKDFEDLAKDWKSNKTYWSYMIGSKIEGEQSLDTISGGTKDVIEALAWQSTIGEAANKQMKDAQDVIASELGSEYANTVNLNSLLKTQSRDLKQRINVATRSYRVELGRRDSLVKKIAKLNFAPAQPEAANKPAGEQIAILNEGLLETEQKIAELDTELQDYAEQINKTGAYQKEIGAIDLSSQDLSTDIIVGQDLVSLQDNLAKFATTLEAMQTTNPQRATYLNDLLKEYSDSEEVFLQSQATQRVVLHPDFKVKQVNSWVQSKIKRNAPLNENTKEWFTETLRTYQKSKVESMSNQAEVKIDEEREARKKAIIEELNSIEDPQDPRIQELQDELDSLGTTDEEVSIPVDKGEVRPKTEEKKIRDEISRLESEKQTKLNEITPELNIRNLEDLDNLTEEQKSKIKEEAKQKIDSLPDDVFFLTHLTQTVGNLKGIVSNGLNASTIAGTTNVSSSKEALYDAIVALVDGKVRHANASNLAIIAFPKNILPEGAKKGDYVDVVENYIVENHPEDFGHRIPSQYNIATFSNGKLNLIQEGISEDKTAAQKEAISNRYDLRIQTLRNELEGNKLTQVEAYKKRISDALKARQNHLTYLGDNYDDVANKKPTQAEVDEYIRLRDIKDFDSLKYQQLQQKLSDWKLLDSAVDEDYVSLGDLILGVEQLEQEVEQEDTLDEITPENAPDISDSEGLQATENVTRYDMLQNTNGSMTVKRRTDGKFTIHHLKLSTIASRMGVDFTLLDKNGNQILFGEEAPGSVLTVEGVEFKVIGGNAIEVKESDFMPLQERLNMYPLNTGKVTWSYSDIYTRVGDDFVKMQSDFTDPTINSERIYDLKEDDRLNITVNNDGYNDKLYSKYTSAKGEKAKQEALKALKDNLKLNATTVDGIKENVSILKASREEIDVNFIRLREKAFDAYMNATDKSNVNLGIEVKVDGIFLGSPRFTITDGNIQSNSITERGAKEVISTGYIENGQLTLSRELKDVNTTFVGKLSKTNANKKIPVVVFKRGEYNIAYPVTMSKTPNNLSSLFDSIVLMQISNQEKVRKINSEIQLNSIKTDKLSYEDVYDQSKLDNVRKAFESVEIFVSAVDFADKNYNRNNLVTDASINIDLENLDNIIADGKLRIKLDDSVKYMTDKELKYESMTNLENELANVAQELYRDYNKNTQSKYVDSKGNIIEDTGYTDTFDETPVEKPTNQLDKIKNINTLRKAFEGLTPRLKKIIGQDTVNKVNEMFKQYDFIKSQITPNKNTVNSGKKNSEC